MPETMPGTMPEKRHILTQTVTRERFSPFGDLLVAEGPPDMIINQEKCGRWHDLAQLDFVGGRAGISLFLAEKRDFPYQLDLLERHPLGSQSFIPMTANPFLAIVASDEGYRPSFPKAFLIPPHHAVSFHRNIWHGVLTPLHSPGLFAVIDRIGSGDNLEEFWFEEPYLVMQKD